MLVSGTQWATVQGIAAASDAFPFAAAFLRMDVASFTLFPSPALPAPVPLTGLVTQFWASIEPAGLMLGTLPLFFLLI